MARLRAVEHGMWRLLWVVWEGWSMDCRKWKNLKAVRGEGGLTGRGQPHSQWASVEEYRAKMGKLEPEAFESKMKTLG